MNNFILSLKDIVKVVGKLPVDMRTIEPVVVKVPHRVTPKYIEENVAPIYKQNRIIQLTTVFSPSSLKDEESSVPEDVRSIQCLVTHNALRFHSKVQKIGERVIRRVSKGSGGDRFVAVDLRVDVLKRKGCSQTSSNGKKCYDADDVSTFLKRLGFASDTPIYVTQSRWDDSLAPIKENFPNVYTKVTTSNFGF